MTMITRYGTFDLPEMREFLRREPDLLIRLEAGLRALETLYFDSWIERTGDGILRAVIFRSYGDFYVSAGEDANMEQLAVFLGFMPMMHTLSGSHRAMEELLPRLPGVDSTTLCTVARQDAPPPAPDYTLAFETTERMEHFRAVHALLSRAADGQPPAFEDYYFTRRGLQKNKSGRTYYLYHKGEAYATASTSGEALGMALLTDVATDRRFRRQGLAEALVGQLCRDLHREQLTPYVTFATAEVVGDFI
ncbi:MAG: hypothetical protein IJF59_04980, partial [Clostridia bacterium]|nr:hypothetical protein [Clostridia bacterium]